eukprot:1161748-Pelagomonas_calceolata.AAC.1
MIHKQSLLYDPCVCWSDLPLRTDTLPCVLVTPDAGSVRQQSQQARWHSREGRQKRCVQQKELCLIQSITMCMHAGEWGLQSAQQSGKGSECKEQQLLLHAWLPISAPLVHMQSRAGPKRSWVAVQRACNAGLCIQCKAWELRIQIRAGMHLQIITASDLNPPELGHPWVKSYWLRMCARAISGREGVGWEGLPGKGSQLPQPALPPRQGHKHLTIPIGCFTLVQLEGSDRLQQQPPYNHQFHRLEEWLYSDLHLLKRTQDLAQVGQEEGSSSDGEH